MGDARRGDEARWLELARVIESRSVQVESLAHTGGCESERVTWLENTTRQIQTTVAGLAQRHKSGAGPGGERHESNSLVGKKVVPERITNRTSLKQWTRRYKVVAVAKDERLKVLLQWAARADRADDIVPYSSGVLGVATLAQHIYASLLMCTEAGREAHSIVDNTPAENGVEAWRRLVQTFDPTLAHANPNLLSEILKPPTGKTDNMSFLVEK